ncbi:DNA polymerase III gamma-tau subunits [Mycoplasma yeatsii 13926]|uniref:DNA polymerase III subunit gamma/tau n=1 Tax=Mycoplasma yeatsii 13926 TaxID=1188240 RepID=S6G6W1_9MOLU|nr:DNA polymerase III subunit gamma/tau [Mycoplasma yeatsii]EOA07213.1 DNA polymerase III gamma-tau subunits [Mycoplasma yeatsii 13926]
METNKQSLYRVYRPKDFNSVAGHKNVIEILKKQISDNKIGHALLFAGQRGTGKTSVARIFAKTINCLNLIESKACDKCSNCIMANENRSSDIIEIDAASNNGVDEIRDIKNSVATLPLNSRYKIYIIDEVHMLTKQAFNALLKTLEEPPMHAVFILATTEFSKIPQTILSRCQIFNFSKIEKQSLTNRLNFITTQEGREIDKETLDEVYYLSEGSLRDAINIIEQLILVSDKKITINNLKSIFLIATKKEQLQIVKSTLNNNSEFIISYFEKANNQGMNWDVFALGIIEIIKEIVEYKLTNNLDFLNVLTHDDVIQFNDFNIKDIFKLADNLADAYSKTKNSNISYNHLLLSLLKSLNTQRTGVKNNDTFIEIQAKNDDIKPIENDIEIEQIILETKEINKISEEEKTVVIEQESIEIQNLDEEDFTAFVETKINVIDDRLDDKECFKLIELKSKLNSYLLDLISMKNNSSIDNMDLINFLSGTKQFKDEKTKVDKLFSDLFATDEFDNLINKDHANNLYMLLDTKLMALTDSVIILKTQSNSHANLINNLMLDEKVLNNIYSWFKKHYFIFAIDDNKKDEIMMIFKDLKSKNKLSDYKEKTFEEIKNKYVKNNKEVSLNKELIQKAKALFDDDFIIGD